MRIENGPRLSDLTTLRIGGRAIALVTLERREDLDLLPDTLARLGGRMVVLGRGSNLLAHDGELAVVLVHPAFAAGPERAGMTDDGRVRVRVDAGVPLPRLVGWSVREGLGDLTGLTGIPGLTGGAVAMNAGSYGRELGDVLLAVEVFSPSQGLHGLQRPALDVAYRHFAVPGMEDALIVTAELALEAGQNAATLEAGMRAIMARKKATQPVTAASAGCVFKNPQGQSAGRLLDLAGYRGQRLGGMAFSEIHANFLVNLGNGTASEALELLGRAQEAVLRMHGVELFCEVKELSC